MAIAGVLVDVLVAATFVTYVVIVRQVYNGFAATRPSQNEAARVCWVSAAALATFIAIATLVAAFLLVVVWPRDVYFPVSLLFLLWPSSLFAWLFILGDNARDEFQLVIYGLPFGLALNVLIAFSVGWLSGQIGNFSASRKKRD